MLGSRVFGHLGLVGAGIFICLSLVGCGTLIDLASGAGGDSEAQRLKSENAELRSENQELQAEVQDLQAEVDDLQSQAAQASAQASGQGEAETESAESEEQEDSEQPESSDSRASNIAVAGSGDTSGSSVPEIMPDNFPLPSGAVLDYTNEGDYNFSLDFLLDSDLESITAFYEQQLQDQGWEEVDRTEYEQDGLAGVETTWERGTYILEGSPQDSDYEQTDESLTLTLQEVQPSGVGGRIFWNSYKLLDETS